MMEDKKKEKKKEYRVFESDTLKLSAFTMVLADIPSPDPDKKDFRKKQMMDARKVLFKDTDFVQRVIRHLTLSDR